MSPWGRIIFSIFGFGLAVTLAVSRGEDFTKDIIAMEFAVFGGLFFIYYGWTGIRDLRKAKQARDES
ncbi:MAG: hypothetical protein AAFQ36_06420 [Pseudomonadota bacterium]